MKQVQTHKHCSQKYFYSLRMVKIGVNKIEPI